MNSEWLSGPDIPYSFPTGDGRTGQAEPDLDFEIVRTEFSDQQFQAPDPPRGLSEVSIIASPDRRPPPVEAPDEVVESGVQAVPVSGHLNPDLSAEIREAVAGLPLYQREGEEEPGPGVDYGQSRDAYAANVIVLYDPDLRQDTETGVAVLSDEAEVLLVQRGVGDGAEGAWGGVSGYIDTVHDPDGGPDEDFDPVRHTAQNELSEECGMAPEGIGQVDFRVGERFSEPRRNGGTLHVVPIVGVVGEKPVTIVDGHELTDQQWVRLRKVAAIPNLSPGYLENTLRSALGGLGWSSETIAELLKREEIE